MNTRRGSAGTGIRDLTTSELAENISADGSSVAVNRYIGINCDAIDVWNPVRGTKRAIKQTGFCEESGESTDTTLAGNRLLWQDGWSANTYSDYSVFTVDSRRPVEAKDLFDYEYTHDDYARQDYGPIAGPFAGHGSLLVFETSVEPKSGPVKNARLWRVDGTRKTLIHRSLDFITLSVDRGRIAGAVAHGPVVLLDRNGRTLRSFRPGLRPRVRVVVLDGSDLLAAGGGKLVVFDVRSGKVKVARRLPAESRLEDYAGGLATLIHGNSIHAFRASDGKDVVVARPKRRGVVGAYVDGQIERSGLFYTYTTESTCCQSGHVVFFPWKTLQRLMH